MGFNAKDATAALQQAAGNVELALNTLLNRDKSAGAATTNGRAVGSTPSSNEPKSGGVANAADGADSRGKGETKSHGGFSKSDVPPRERGG